MASEKGPAGRGGGGGGAKGQDADSSSSRPSSPPVAAARRPPLPLPPRATTTTTTARDRNDGHDDENGSRLRNDYVQQQPLQQSAANAGSADRSEGDEQEKEGEGRQVGVRGPASATLEDDGASGGARADRTEAGLLPPPANEATKGGERYHYQRQQQQHRQQKSERQNQPGPSGAQMAGTRPPLPPPLPPLPKGTDDGPNAPSSAHEKRIFGKSSSLPPTTTATATTMTTEDVVQSSPPSRKRTTRGVGGMTYLRSLSMPLQKQLRSSSSSTTQPPPLDKLKEEEEEQQKEEEAEPMLPTEVRRLYQSLVDAGEDAWGVDAVELWVLESDGTGRLVRPTGGWWRNPQMTSAAATTTATTDAPIGNAVDDDYEHGGTVGRTSSSPSECLSRLEDERNPHFVAADPVVSGVDLPGHLWAESLEVSSLGGPNLSGRGGRVFENLSGRGGNIFAALSSPMHHTGGHGSSQGGSIRGGTIFGGGGGGGSTRGGNFFGGGGSTRGGTLFGGGSTRGGTLFGGGGPRGHRRHHSGAPWTAPAPASASASATVTAVESGRSNGGEGQGSDGDRPPKNGRSSSPPQPLPPSSSQDSTRGGNIFCAVFSPNGSLRGGNLFGRGGGGGGSGGGEMMEGATVTTATATTGGIGGCGSGDSVKDGNVFAALSQSMGDGAAASASAAAAASSGGGGGSGTASEGTIAGPARIPGEQTEDEEKAGRTTGGERAGGNKYETAEPTAMQSEPMPKHRRVATWGGGNAGPESASNDSHRSFDPRRRIRLPRMMMPGGGGGTTATTQRGGGDDGGEGGSGHGHPSPHHHHHHHHHPRVVWRNIASLLADPDTPKTPRLAVLSGAGFVHAAGVTFDSAGWKGIVIYLTRIADENAEELVDCANQAYMARAAEVIGTTFSAAEARRTAMALRPPVEPLDDDSGRADLDRADLADIDKLGSGKGPWQSPRMTARKRIAIWLRKTRGGSMQAPPAMTVRQSTWTLVGCFISLLLLSGLSDYIKSQTDGLFFFMGPMGALVALQYGLTAAPASQPRNVVAGQVVAGAIAMAFTHIPEDIISSWLRQALAPSFAIAGMAKLGILHPPAGAASIILASGNFGWDLYGLLIAASVISLLPAVLINNMSTKRQYPTGWGVGF